MEAYSSGNSPIGGFGAFGPNFTGDVQCYNYIGITNAQFQTWVKPQKASMVYIFCLGAGGGGGGGCTGASTTARGGGAGGSSAGISRLILPACLLPNTLKVQVGKGGAGGTAGNPGSAGGISYISMGVGISTGIAQPDVVLASSSVTAPGGNQGTNAGGGTGGGTTTIFTAGGFTTWGIYLGFAGRNGRAGGAQTGQAGVNSNSVWNAECTSEGAGGGGVNSLNSGFAGGNQGMVANFDWDGGGYLNNTGVLAGTAGSATAAGNGNQGIEITQPFMCSGGSGGGSSDGSTGGNGGKGGTGCGGGGGGGGTTGGTGGDGGDGLIVIVSW